MNGHTPHSSYRKGVKRVGLYYLTGIIAAVVFHLIVGWENMYAPPPSTLVVVFLMVIGILWATLNFTSLFSMQGRPQTLGELTVHVTVFIIVVALVFSGIPDA